MPKVNGPEVGKGFWITVGVLLALLLVGIVSTMVRTVAAKRAG